MTFAPITGAWIETLCKRIAVISTYSHPSRVRGLKLPLLRDTGLVDIRTHHGCVD